MVRAHPYPGTRTWPSRDINAPDTGRSSRRRTLGVVDQTATIDSGGPVSPVRRPRPAVPPLIIEEELSLLATAVLRVLAGDSRPQRWGAPAFERELGLVRGHLTPIRSRPLLAASFGREGFRGPVDAAPERVARRVSVDAVHVAYALRWLELSDS